jgi:folate-binding protein YgfZ
VELPDGVLGPRDVVTVEGSDAVSYLHSQATQNIATMAVGEQRWTFLLDPTGKIEVLARVRRVADERLELDTDAGYGEALLARINRFKIRVKADTSLVPAEVDVPARDETARVAVGWPAMGAEIVAGETLVAGSGLSQVAVDFRKGCYPGQELVERMDSRGAEPPRRLCRLPVGEYDPATVEVTSTAGGQALAWVKRGNEIGTAVTFGV